MHSLILVCGFIALRMCVWESETERLHSLKLCMCVVRGVQNLTLINMCLCVKASACTIEYYICVCVGGGETECLLSLIRRV